MFNKDVEHRLSVWLELRKSLEINEDPLMLVWEFWKTAPFIPYNRNIDQHNQPSWPSPWDIIVENKYDEFTRALMIGLTLKLTNKFQNASIELRTLVDSDTGVRYNVICIDELHIINYSDLGPVTLESLPSSIILENLIII
jgi:hypothetical protein